jgi:hypothetical protein
MVELPLGLKNISEQNKVYLPRGNYHCQEVPQPPYPTIMVYAVDWHQYSGQHDPKSGEPYKAIKGWVAGFLLEETNDHIAITSTSFETGDVRYVVVIPKCAIIERI